MTSWAIKFVAVLAAITLALPAGWCCACHTGTVQAAPRKSCCQAQAAAEQTSQPAPASPQAKCCCSERVATPTTGTWHPERAASAFLALPVQASPAAGELIAATSPILIFPGPPLRILQGVWRC